MGRYDENNNPYSWMPRFLRRFLNLTYDEIQVPGSTQDTSQASFSYAPPSATTSVAWTPRNAPTFTASNMESYRAPAGATPVASYTPPPAPTPRPPANNASAIPSSSAAPVQSDGYVILPITDVLRGFLRGVLPPQGLEAFAKEVRTTTTAVWDLYSRWFQFQTDEPFRFIRAILDTVTAGATSASSGAVSSTRRIKVTIANGDDHADPTAAVVGSRSKA